MAASSQKSRQVNEGKEDDVCIQMENGGNHPNNPASGLSANGETNVTSTRPNLSHVQAKCLTQIAKNPELYLSLNEWENNFKRARERIEAKRKRVIDVKNELYQLMGFYSVFQGVVFTAVAQANALKCHTAWGPATLSLLASIATLASVRKKFQNYSELKVAVKNEEEDAKVTADKIRMLKLHGDRFDFSLHAAEDRKAHRTGTTKINYYWLVMIFLGFFSFIVISCCISILCWQ